MPSEVLKQQQTERKESKLLFQKNEPTYLKGKLSIYNFTFFLSTSKAKSWRP